MKKPFEDYISLIENVLEVKLFKWQKDVLLQIYNGNYGSWIFSRCRGITALDMAALIIYEEIARDTKNLPRRLYELDGYSADTAKLDEHWRENIEWEKEKKI